MYQVPFIYSLVLELIILIVWIKVEDLKLIILNMIGQVHKLTMIRCPVLLILPISFTFCPHIDQFELS